MAFLSRILHVVVTECRILKLGNECFLQFRVVHNVLLCENMPAGFTVRYVGIYVEKQGVLKKNFSFLRRKLAQKLQILR